MAATVTAYQQYGFSSPEELDEACSAAYAAMQESLTELKQVEKTLNGKKELQRQVLAYSKTDVYKRQGKGSFMPADNTIGEDIDCLDGPESQSDSDKTSEQYRKYTKHRRFL